MLEQRLSNGLTQPFQSRVTLVNPKKQRRGDQARGSDAGTRRGDQENKPCAGLKESTGPPSMCLRVGHMEPHTHGGYSVQK